MGNELLNKMVDRLVGASSLQGANLDDATFAKTHSDRSLGQLHAPSHSIIASLPGPSALKNEVISRIQATNRACSLRDIRASAVEDATKEGMDKSKWMLGLGEGDYLTKAQVREMPGVTGPIGIFDPLGLSTQYPEGNLYFYRAAEVKHGRICMLAFLGIVTTEGGYHPLFGGDIDVPAYLLGTPYIQETPINQFWPSALAALAIFDAGLEYGKKNLENEEGISKPKWDYGWDPLGIFPKDAKEQKEMQTKELNNGRLAMLATAGIIAQELVTGQKVFR